MLSDSIRPVTPQLLTRPRTSPQGPRASTLRKSVVAVPVTVVPLVVRFNSMSNSAGHWSPGSCSTIIPSGLVPTQRTDAAGVGLVGIGAVGEDAVGEGVVGAS